MALRETDRARSFGSAAAEYERLRAGAPLSTADWLTDHEIGSAVELGAGTGHFSRTLVRHVQELFAVEPDARMREIFRASVPGVTVLDGNSRENTVRRQQRRRRLHKRRVALVRPEQYTGGNRAGIATRRPTRRAVESVRRGRRWMAHLFSVIDSEHDPRCLPGTFTLPTDAGFAPPEQQVLRWTRPMSPRDLVALPAPTARCCRCRKTIVRGSTTARTNSSTGTRS